MSSISIPLSERVRAIKPSPTLAVTDRARALRAAGKDVIGLGAGEPDFDTPEHIKQAAVAAIAAGDTKYTAVDGTPELKTTIQAKFQHQNELDYELNQILVSVGAKHSLFNLFMAMVEPGVEVIIPAPYWVSYPDMVIMAGGTPVIVAAGADQAFKITPDQLAAAITPRTRMLVLNSPSNPTGAVYSHGELKALGEVLEANPQVWVVTDDIYEHIRWDEDQFHNIVNVCPELYERAVVINGVSKTYAMTGWRIGYAAGPAPLIGAMKKIQSQSTSNPCSISQAAAVAALSGDQHFVFNMAAEFERRHAHVLGRLNQIRGIHALPALGAFYSFPDCSAAIAATDGVGDDMEFATHLLEQAGVALVPGSAFGMPGCLRLSFATGIETLDRALDRLEETLGRS